MTHCLQLFTMEPFHYLDESMQHTIQDSRDGGVADIGYHGDDSRQVAQSSSQQGDCEPVLMDEDKPVPEYGCESSKEDDCDWNSKDNVGTVCFGEARDEQFLHQLRNVFSAYDF